MKRYFLLFFTLLLVHATVMAQKLTVENFALDPTDLAASTQRRDDGNGQACALVKVRLARPGATFYGNVMGDTPYSQSVYMVYLMHESKYLEVRLDGYLPVKIDFANDWGYRNGVESLTTYVLSIILPNVAGQPMDDGKSYFTLTVTPPNASFLFDGKLCALDQDGTFKDRIPRGQHTYQLTANGYATKQGSFTLGTERKDLNETLVPAQATLTVDCPTSGVEIYVNEEKKTNSSLWSGVLKSGSYLIEARKDGYISQLRSITLSDNQSLKVDFPELSARVGMLDVNYKPFNADVWIDGKKVGTAPDLFKNLTVGSHHVEIRKEGYQSETKTVNIAEGQTATLSGSLASAAATASASSTSTVSNVASAASSSNVSGTTAAKQPFTVNGVRFTMVRVEGGTFTMGATSEQGSDADSDEKPAHEVTLSTYSIGETEVTQELWEAVMGSNPSRFKGSKRPVEQVSWSDCQNFIKKLNKKTKKTFRLPTEAEWEYAARGGNRSRRYKYSGSDTLGDVAWYKDNSGFTTHDVATKQSNELGLYDMSGNVWEWCSDWYGSYSSGSPTNPQGANSGPARVYRGGGWRGIARCCRSSDRSNLTPGDGDITLGLRLVLSE